MVNSKSAFWQALVFTILIFGIGLIIGFFFESHRTDLVQFNVMQSEINLLDEQLREKIINNEDISCDVAVNSTFNFADRIYKDASKLEDYDASSKFTNSLKEIHKRYDLLRIMLWIEAQSLKERCSSDFHTVVYFFDYDSDKINTKAKQVAFSRLLLDIKVEQPNKVLLIPIASNLNLDSVNLTLNRYNISESPAIIIDEKRVVKEIIDYEELENIVFKSNKE